MLDYGFDAGFSILTSNAQAPRGAVSGWFRAHGREARVLILMPGHAPGPLTRWLERWHAHEPGGVLATAAMALVSGVDCDRRERAAVGAPRSQRAHGGTRPSSVSGSRVRSGMVLAGRPSSGSPSRLTQMQRIPSALAGSMSWYRLWATWTWFA